MAEPADKTTTIRIRGSRMQMQAVRQNAEQADLQLAQEQDDSDTHLSRALAQITDSEGIAHLDGRLTFVERQMERLGSRRDEADRVINSELAVMRVRLENTLSAFAAATQEHREAMGVSERRLQMLAAEADRSARMMVESLRGELAAGAEEAGRVAERMEARIAGEQRMFADEAARRATVLAGTISTGRQALDARLEAALAEVDERMAAALAQVDAHTEAVLTDLMAAASPVERDGLLADVEGHVAACLEAPLQHVELLRASLADAALVHARVVDTRSELLDVLQASEDKALAAAEHLESMILQVRRRLVSDEAEWSAVVGEAGDAMAALGTRVEDLLERVCSLEAAGAAERASAGVQLAGIDRRLDLHEEVAQNALGHVAELGARITSSERAVEAQVGAVAAVRTLVEEQAGAIVYLQRMVAELSDRFDAARSIGDPPAIPLPGLAGQPESGAALEADAAPEDLEEVAFWQRDAAGPGPLDEMRGRLQALEASLSALYGVQNAGRDAAGMAALQARMDQLVEGMDFLADRQDEVDARLDQVLPSAAIPLRRRRRAQA